MGGLVLFGGFGWREHGWLGGAGGTFFLVKMDDTMHRILVDHSFSKADGSKTGSVPYYLEHAGTDVLRARAPAVFKKMLVGGNFVLQSFFGEPGFLV